MIGPLPPFPTTERPELPRVRLEVRASAGRPVTYEVGGEEFLIGGAGGCDLRVPTPNLPPVICQITRKPDGVRVRRLTPAVPILLNGSPLTANVPVPVNSGDKLNFSGLELVVSIEPSVYVSPKLITLEANAAPATNLPTESNRTREPDRRTTGTAHHERPAARKFEPARETELARWASELEQRAQELEQRAQELEADRVIWYRRRQEIEAEIERHRQAETALDSRQAELQNWERELNRTRDQLVALRERLSQDHRRQQEELERQQAAVRAANTLLEQDRRAAEAELEQRRAELQAEIEKERSALRAEAEDRRRHLEEEYRQRRAALDAELATYEPRLRELREQHEQLTAATQELARQRELLSADRTVLDGERASFEAGRSAETERLSNWENRLAEREAELARREEQLRADREVLESDRREFQADLTRLERRTAALEEQERLIAERKREVDVRLQQLRRDAAEWEETVRLATTEQTRLRAEAERLDRQRAELDAQSATLTERAGQLEAQQAVLAVLRAQLERTRQQAEREAAQLAAARVREDEALAELRERIREAEELRAELTSVQENTAQERRRLEERDSLLSAALEEIRTQQEALAAEATRLKKWEAELDARAADFAEQAGTLKGRMTQALDLQARLEADRVALREREAALARAEESQQALQEQLRRRAEELAVRARSLDELARQIAGDRAAVEQIKAQAEAHRLTALDEINERRRQVEEQAAALERVAAEYADKEQALARQVARLKEVGATVAAERKNLQELRARWESDRAAAAEADRARREEFESFRLRVLAEIEALRREAPELETQAQSALERLTLARDMLRGHLNELHDYARLSREDLTAIRAQIQHEAERLRAQEEELNRAKAEHRLALSAFRQQLIDWQGQVAEIKRTLAQSESRLEAREAAVDEAARQVDATSAQLAEQSERLRREREAVSARRTEVERHLNDMREWYRKKLRELARSTTEPDGPASDRPPLVTATETQQGPQSRPVLHVLPAAADEVDPGDRQLGELLRSHGLIDADTLEALWVEAGRKRRTLRQVLLSSGAITLYQLALIEAGNLDSLMLGRFRVIDRLRVTSREAIYRVFDPTASSEPTSPSSAPAGVFLLRHLSESEMHVPAHADEYRRGFAAARDVKHPYLVAVTEVLDIAGRPAAVQEWLSGLYSADWSFHAAHPGCWVRLATMAAQALEAAHRHGLYHGRLTSDCFVLTTSGVLKVTGFGEPSWLTPGGEPGTEASAAADLRAFGQVAFGWSQLANKQPRKSVKSKPFPAALTRIIRRLEADIEPPMADTVAAERPYESASELLADLNRAARETPFSDDAWEKLLKHVADNTPEAPLSLRRSA